MTDLLEQLREVNPVPRCEPPPIADVWRKLNAVPADRDGRDERRPALTPGRSRVGHGVRALPALAGVAVGIAVLVVAVSNLHARSKTAPGASDRPAWTVQSDGPSLSSLVAHFAVLRRPPTRAERAAVPAHTPGVGTRGQREAPTFLRILGRADGSPVYLVVYADHRSGASGPIDGYSAEIDSSDGMAYIEGNYAIFPFVDGSEPERRGAADVSVVPDGVRTVRWRFACPAGSNGTGCVLPAQRHVVTVAVHGNLAVLPLGRLNPGTSWAQATSVTWFHTDGTQTTFDNAEAAVPFAGAPAVTAPGPPPAPEASGNGRLAGRPLAAWRAQFAVLRRPQTALDWAAAAKAARVNSDPIVPALTRVVLDQHGVQIFIALSAVDPNATAGDRRYVATVGTIGPGGTYASQTFSPGVEGPTPIEAMPRITWYSLVPDDVTKVQWTFACQPACGVRTTPTVTLTPHDNIVRATESPVNGSVDVRQVAWYVRGRRHPLRANG